MPSVNKINYRGTEYDLYGLGGDVLPVGSIMEIESTATVPLGWEEVDTKYEVYDEGEKCIGRWLDGKPLYRFCYKFSKTTSGNTPVTFQNMGLTDYTKFDNITRSELHAISSPNNFVANEYYYSDKDFYGHYILQDRTAVIFRSGADWPKLPTEFVFIICYTKTTDTANTPITKKIRKKTQTVPPSILDTYDTNEQVVGKWLDNKPLYQKTYVYNNLVANTIVNIGDTPLNYDFIQIVEGVFVNSVCAYSISAFVESDGFYAWVRRNGNTANPNKIAVKGTSACDKVYVTVRYTKTTD